MRLAGKGTALELLGAARVEEVLRHAAAALGVRAGIKAALIFESRLLRADEWLTEAGVGAGGVVDVLVGQVGGWGGPPAVEYLGKIVLLLEDERSTANASRAEELSKQVDVLQSLKTVMEARQLADASLVTGGLSAEAGTGPMGVRFDADIDADEVLLRLFHDVDIDRNGKISMEELLNAPMMRQKFNADMAQTLRRALGASGCSLAVLEKSLEPLKEEDLDGGVATSVWGRAKGKSAAARAIFDAVVPALQVAAPLDHAGGDERVAMRADLERFLAAQDGPLQGSSLAAALQQLATTLPIQDEELDFTAVKAAARKVPRVAARRLEWVRSMNLDGALARHLPPGTLDDGCVRGGLASAAAGGGVLAARYVALC